MSQPRLGADRRCGVFWPHAVAGLWENCAALATFALCLFGELLLLGSLGGLLLGFLPRVLGFHGDDAGLFESPDSDSLRTHAFKNYMARLAQRMS